MEVERGDCASFIAADSSTSSTSSSGNGNALLEKTMQVNLTNINDYRNLILLTELKCMMCCKTSDVRFSGKCDLQKLQIQLTTFINKGNKFVTYMATQCYKELIRGLHRNERIETLKPITTAFELEKLNINQLEVYLDILLCVYKSLISESGNSRYAVNECISIVTDVISSIPRNRCWNLVTKSHSIHIGLANIVKVMFSHSRHFRGDMDKLPGDFQLRIENNLLTMCGIFCNLLINCCKEDQFCYMQICKMLSHNLSCINDTSSVLKDFSDIVLKIMTFELYPILSESQIMIGFCHNQMDGTDEMRKKCSERIYRATFLVKLKAASILLVAKKNTLVDVDCEQIIVETLNNITKVLKLDKSYHKDAWVIELFLDQDEMLFDMLLCVLNIYCALSSTDVLDIQLNPHYLMIHFMSNIGFDHSVVLDYLVSSETCFLHFFTKYIQLILSEWEEFTRICDIYKSIDTFKKAEGSDFSSESEDHLESSNICSDESYHYEEGNLENLPVDQHSDIEEIDDESDLVILAQLKNSSEFHIISILDDIMTLFIRLRIHMMKMNKTDNLSASFDSIVELIEKCEEMYEK